MNSADLRVLYEDNHLLVVLKPAGVLVQGDYTGDISLLEIGKQWLIEKYQKPGKAFLGLVHRLDRPVAGIVVFAKTSKAAGRISHQIRERTVQKTYLAVVEGRLSSQADRLTHYIRKSPANRRVQIASSPFTGGAQAELSYRVIEETADKSLLRVNLHTGRHHQIRAQMACIGHPILGDRKYRSSLNLPEQAIALFAFQMRMEHPTRHTDCTFQALPPEEWPWTLFQMGKLDKSDEKEDAFS